MIFTATLLPVFNSSCGEDDGHRFQYDKQLRYITLLRKGATVEQRESGQKEPGRTMR
jgi:hypothetical protein